MLSWCVGSFFVALLKYPDKSNLKEKGEFWLTVQGTVLCGGKDIATGKKEA